jgi:hypothetical protein
VLLDEQFATAGAWSNVIANNTQLTFEFGRFTMPTRSGR